MDRRALTTPSLTVACAALLLAGLLVAAAPALGATDGWHKLDVPHHTSRLPAPRVVDPSRSPGFHVYGGGGHDARRQRRPETSPSTAPTPTVPSHAPVISSGGHVIESAVGRTAAPSLTQEITWTGATSADTQGPTPPDPAIAADGGFIVEMVNGLVTGYYDDGSLVFSFPLSAIFPTSPAFPTTTEPKIVYDTWKHEFFAVVTQSNPATSTSRVMVAETEGAWPPDPWTLHQIAVSPLWLYGQPNIASTESMILVTANDYGPPPAPRASWWLVDSDFFSVTEYNDPLFHFDLVPASDQRSRGLVGFYLRSALGVTQAVAMNVDGLLGGPIGISERAVTIRPISNPPGAVQPGGPPLDAGPFGFQSAAFFGNELDAVSAETCIVGGAPHACIRLVQFDWSSGTVLLDADIGTPSLDMIAPAIGITFDRTMFLTYTITGLGLFPTSQALSIPQPLGTAPIQTSDYGSGNSPYRCMNGPTICSTNRLGDYSGVSVSIYGDTAWVVSVNGGIGCSPSPCGNWRTSIAGYTVDAPEIESITPHAGRFAGGEVVHIEGDHFAKFSSVTFGGRPATIASYGGPQDLFVLTPSATPFNCGTFISISAPVQVTTDSGSSQLTPFSYDVVPTVASVTPSVGPAGGGATVTISGCGFQDVSAVTFGSTPAESFTVDSTSSITAVSPASAAGLVEVHVTTPGGTSALTGSCRPPTCPFYSFEPTALTIAPTAGPRGTVVTFTGTGFRPGGLVLFSYYTKLSFPVYVVLARPTADALGRISGTGTIPTSALAGPLGRHQIQAKEKKVKAKAVFKLTP